MYCLVSGGLQRKEGGGAFRYIFVFENWKIGSKYSNILNICCQEFSEVLIWFIIERFPMHFKPACTHKSSMHTFILRQTIKSVVNVSMQIYFRVCEMDYQHTEAWILYCRLVLRIQMGEIQLRNAVHGTHRGRNLSSHICSMTNLIKSLNWKWEPHPFNHTIDITIIWFINERTCVCSVHAQNSYALR